MCYVDKCFNHGRFVGSQDRTDLSFFYKISFSERYEMFCQLLKTRETKKFSTRTIGKILRVSSKLNELLVNAILCLCAQMICL